MASKKQQKVKMSRKAKIVIGVVITVAVFCGIIMGLFLAWKNMFSLNNRFWVLRVNVTSAEGQGKWHGKVKEVMPIVMNAKVESKDKTPKEVKIKNPDKKELLNMFDLDLKKLREELEKVPEIEKVEVRRILPDTLDIKITERVPMAFLERNNGTFLVDKDCVVIRKSHSIDISGVIPYIITHKKKLPPAGEQFEEVKPALEFIQLTKKVPDYAVLKIVEMDLVKEDYITMLIHYSGDSDDWFIARNVPSTNPSEGLDRILTSIESARKESQFSREIDLRYNGQTVLKKEER